MEKIWVRLYKENKLMGDALAAVQAASSALKLEEGLKECCRMLDLSNPMILKKHEADIRQYAFTRFLPSDFLEPVSFDRMEVTFFDDTPKKANE